ncbi:hypothetical protein [Sphingobacterium hotanense]|uniref:hypothetical protein n=1 Tax=Sphingobacterium hotanense TaxID=649196 RepID=UPI0021A45194|nr:hypothetical protein [Sphingobacterium hotanense]MCT1526208.1 hypothetical protein [Sphingobacterium hotanense]
MTIKEKLISLRENFAMKSEAYLKADQKIFEEGNGFFDKKLLGDLSDAKTAWQKAANDYNAFLSHVLNNQLNIEAEID